MKKILISSIVILFVFLIYLANLDKKVYYLNLGDSLIIGNNYNSNTYSNIIKDYLFDKDLLGKYNDGYYMKSIRTTDLINMIDNNYKNDKGVTIKHALIKADLLTLSIGINDLINQISIIDKVDENELYQYVDEVMIDMDKLLEKIRTYCKEDIVLIGYYNPIYTDHNTLIDDIIIYMNNKIQGLSNKYKIKYLDVYETIKKHPSYINESGYSLSIYGNKEVANKIIDIINNTLLK